ncbi:hypothetical protein EI982_02010 [Haloplanus rallus]|uniref:DUF1102 domain-containing protein n=1 Tax=Haloplanus rallus TaxID=1816183 RepID=A0A6B9F327_9EURY|nr:hypothetical protein [Haloplanus rallus]QGX93652.1 hypothetical protein EI982_02010 [Haloplanus rallus]
MERRKFIATMGSIAAGGAATVGTGAFTSVEADRSVDVAVEDDASAYLGLDTSGDANDQYVSGQGSGEIVIDFDDSGNSGTGVNPNANTVLESVFQIENQGTQEVDVSLSGSGISIQGQGTEISAPGSDGIAASLSDDAGDATLGTGDSIDVDFAVNSGTSDLSGTLTIDADAT